LFFHQDLIETADRLIQFLAEARCALVGAFCRKLTDATSATGSGYSAVAAFSAARSAAGTARRFTRGIRFRFRRRGTATKTFARLTHATDAARECTGVTTFAAGISVTITITTGITGVTAGLAAAGRITVRTAAATALTGRRRNSFGIVGWETADFASAVCPAGTAAWTFRPTC
jgi:hypothetical protein